METQCRKKYITWCHRWQRSEDQVQGVKNRSAIERKRSSSGSHGSGRTIHSVQGHRTANGLQESCFDEASSVDERCTKLFHQKGPSITLLAATIQTTNSQPSPNSPKKEHRSIQESLSPISATPKGQAGFSKGAISNSCIARGPFACRRNAFVSKEQHFPAS